MVSSMALLETARLVIGVVLVKGVRVMTHANFTAGTRPPHSPRPHPLHDLCT